MVGLNSTVSTRLLALVEPSSFLLLGTAVAVVVLAAIRSLWHETSQRQGKNIEDTALTLNGAHVLLLPLCSSATLLLVFYFFSRMALVLTLLSMLSSGLSVAFALLPLWEYFLGPVERRWRGAKGAPAHSLDLTKASLCLFSLLLVLSWMASGHWFLSNVLSSCLCATLVSLVRIPNLRLACALMALLFLYDIFWVFGSEWVWGTNVMVAAATKKARNPMVTAAHVLHLPAPRALATHLDLPVKLQYPTGLFSAAGGQRLGFLILGLGDIALPAMLLALVLSLDYKRFSKGRPGNSAACPAHTDPDCLGGRWWSRGYCMTAAMGYSVGLVFAFVLTALTNKPQPALLYLVPFTLAPLLAQALGHGELLDIWTAPRPVFCATDEKVVEV